MTKEIVKKVKHILHENFLKRAHKNRILLRHKLNSLRNIQRQDYER